MAKNRTRRNKNRGGSRKNKNEMMIEEEVMPINNTGAMGGKRRNKSEGGRRKTRKASSWTKSVTALYHKMKKADKNTQFKDALVEASRLKKKGQL
jgi:hypothetical protein